MNRNFVALQILPWGLAIAISGACHAQMPTLQTPSAGATQTPWETSHIATAQMLAGNAAAETRTRGTEDVAALPPAPMPESFAESSSLTGLPAANLAPYYVSAGYAPKKRQAVWGPSTSGPFFTGTAEVEPMGSSYVEPFLFANRKKGSSSNVFNQKMSLGLGNNLEFDAQMPMIANSAESSATQSGSTVRQFGPGDLHLSFKYQLTQDQNTYKLLARPALALTTDFYFPTGKATGLQPNRYGTDQFGNGNFQQGLSLLIHKRVHPFAFYGQVGDLIEDPAHVSKGYGYNNGIDTVASGRNVRMVDGNLLYYSGALEYVMNTRHGLGVLAEVDGQSQSLHNLFFGKATAPSYSYLAVAPELEFTTPAGKRFGITWGAGVNIPVERNNFERVITPMVTATFYFNGPNGGRSSE